ncbi:hypothetical protein [Rhodococcus sp. HNM0569]|uniref:8-oxoguanine DNA glycosylase OGG fold protein n=1 Tax=Rhodococcus sp. HNM0569 TaxID=2716340 RepID=UPI00146E97B6|nr:hypothetical protein [Rhodococcus sp. HNM0569]NLU82457.1 hypothetical protein [Rhodococcus sp. HNM0569]
MNTEVVDADIARFASLGVDLPDRHDVLAQSARFDRARWIAALPDPRMWPAELTDAARDGRWHVVDRATVFDVGARVTREPSEFGAVQLYVAAAVWGTGTSARDVPRRMRPLVQDGVVGKLGVALDVLEADGPVAAYEALSRGGAAHVPYLGAPFFTKMLYFASASGGGALVLDRNVVQTLAHAGVVEWNVERAWTAEQYATYLDLVRGWAAHHGTTGDVVECVLSAVGRELFRIRNRAAA